MRGDFLMYDLGDGFYGFRLFRDGRWMARLDIPPRFHDDLHTAVKLGILKALKVANTPIYDDSEGCRLDVRLLSPSVAVDCPIRNGITADVTLVWKTLDGQTAMLIELKHRE